jgi:hypothetical protein
MHWKMKIRNNHIHFGFSLSLQEEFAHSVVLRECAYPSGTLLQWAWQRSNETHRLIYQNGVL